MTVTKMKSLPLRGDMEKGEAGQEQAGNEGERWVREETGRELVQVVINQMEEKQPNEKLEWDGVGVEMMWEVGPGTHGRHCTDASPVISWLSQESSEVCIVTLILLMETLSPREIQLLLQGHGLCASISSL